MGLLEYLKSLEPSARESFAKAVGTSVDYLFQIAYGKRQPKAALVIAIERESHGAVRCEDVLPTADWNYLRATAKASLAL